MNKKELEERMKDKLAARWGCATRNPHYCRTCIFAHGKPPFEDSPEKGHCMIFTRESGISKPERVYYHGGLCQYYSNENEVDEDDEE